MAIEIPRKNNFTFIRFILAYIVLIRHCMDSSVQAIFIPFKGFFESQDAVCLFFVISGLLVTSSYERSPSLKSYAFKRLRRIFPLYLFAVVGAAIVLSLASTLPVDKYFTDSRFWKYLFWNGLTLNFMQKTLPGVFEANPYNASVNDALWTIKNELFFYVCLPLICLGIHKLKRRHWRNLFLIALYFLSFGYRQICWKLSSLLGIPLLATLAMEAPGYLGAFLLGVFCYYNFDLLSPLFSRAIPFFCFIASVSLLLLSNLGLLFRIPDIVKYIILAYSCIYAAFSFEFFHSYFQRLDCSYAVYLFHFPLLQWMIGKGFFSASPWLSLYLCACSTFTLAYAVSLLEKHLPGILKALEKVDKYRYTI